MKSRFIPLILTGAVGVLPVLVLAAPAADAATGTVITSGVTLNIRSGPGTSYPVTGSLAPGTVVSFGCYEQGTAVTGTYGTETIWDHLDSGGFVSDAWVLTGSNSAKVPACGSSTPAPPPQQPSGQYRIAWSGGGFSPRTGTTASDPAASSLYKAAEDTNPGAPADSLPATLADGTPVTLVCETTGDTVVDTAGYVSDLWDEVSTGGYVPNAYIDTGVKGPTPGVPQCRYNRLDAVLWALQNVGHAELIGGGDCTWFASQAAWAGGLPQSSTWAEDSPNGVLGTGPRAAYLRARAGYSPDAPINPTRTATTANEFFKYFNGLVASGLVTIKKVSWSDNAVGGAQFGDFIAYDWQDRHYQGGSDGIIDHIAVVTYVSPATSYPSVSQHTVARTNRFWSWSPSGNTWIQDDRSYVPAKGSPNGQPVAYLIHING